MNINYERNGKKNASTFPKDSTETKLVFLYIDRQGIDYYLELLQINK